MENSRRAGKNPKLCFALTASAGTESGIGFRLNRASAIRRSGSVRSGFVRRTSGHFDYLRRAFLNLENFRVPRHFITSAADAKVDCMGGAFQRRSRLGL